MGQVGRYPGIVKHMGRGASPEVSGSGGKNVRLVWWVAVVGMVGTPLFFAFIFIIGATRDGYSFMSDEISQLSAAGVPGAWAQSTNFIVYGLILIGLAVGTHWGMTDGEGSIVGPVLIGAFGLLAAFGNGLFPTDQIGSPETTSGTIHSLTAGFGFLAVIAAMFVLPRRMSHDGDWTDLVGPSRVIGISAAILMVTYLVVSESEGLLDGYVGLIQRVFAATVLLWLFLLALRLFRTSTAQQPNSGLTHT